MLSDIEHDYKGDKTEKEKKAGTSINSNNEGLYVWGCY
jgi:hypothetical protein